MNTILIIEWVTYFVFGFVENVIQYLRFIDFFNHILNPYAVIHPDPFRGINAYNYYPYVN